MKYHADRLVVGGNKLSLVWLDEARSIGLVWRRKSQTVGQSGRRAGARPFNRYLVKNMQCLNTAYYCLLDSAALVSYFILLCCYRFSPAEINDIKLTDSDALNKNCRFRSARWTLFQEIISKSENWMSIKQKCTNIRLSVDAVLGEVGVFWEKYRQLCEI